jgi:hypothetical protein
MKDGRTHLRHHGNILKRLLVHVPGFNLGLVMRALFGIGKPRGLQDGPAAAILAVLNVILRAVGSLWSRWDRFCRIPTSPTTEITHSPAR